MGKGGGSSAPPAPDYSSLARQQAALNNQASYQQTVANRPTQVTPQGTLTWVNNPTMQNQLDAQAYAQALQNYSKNPRGPAPNQQDFYKLMPVDNWTQTITLSPEQQALYNQQTANQQMTGGLAGQILRGVNTAPLDFSQAPQVNALDFSQAPDLASNNTPLPSLAYGNSNLPELASTNFSSLPSLASTNPASLPNLAYPSGSLPDRAALTGSLSALPDSGFGAVQQVQDAMMSRLQPNLTQARDAEIQRLKSQGITEGTPAWESAMRSLNNQANDANQQALLAATNAYGDIFNRGLAGRQQQYSELADTYNRSLAGRQQAIGEQQNAFANSLAGRQQLANEQQNAFANSLAGRQQLASEQQNAFANSLAGRQQMYREQQGAFANSLAGRQQLFNEQQGLFGNSLAARQQSVGEALSLYNSQVNDRNRAIQELLTQRQSPINEYTALVNGTAVQQPNFSNFTQATPTMAPDMQSAAQQQYNAAMQQYNASQQAKANQNAGLFGLGGTLLTAPLTGGGSVAGGLLGGIGNLFGKLF